MKAYHSTVFAVNNSDDDTFLHFHSHFQSFLSQPPFPIPHVYPLLLTVSAILYIAALWDIVREHFINGTVWAWGNQTFSPLWTHSSTKCHVLFFYITYVYVYSASVCPVLNISAPVESVTYEEETICHMSQTHGPLSKLLTMNVTYCAFLWEIQHISPAHCTHTWIDTDWSS